MHASLILQIPECSAGALTLFKFLTLAHCVLRLDTPELQHEKTPVSSVMMSPLLVVSMTSKSLLFINFVSIIEIIYETQLNYNRYFHFIFHFTFTGTTKPF